METNIEEVKNQLEALVNGAGYRNPQVSITNGSGRVNISVLAFKVDTWYECETTADRYTSAPAALENAIRANKMVPYGQSR